MENNQQPNQPPLKDGNKSTPEPNSLPLESTQTATVPPADQTFLTKDPITTPEIEMPKYQMSHDPKIVRAVVGGFIALVVIIGLSIFLAILNNQAKDEKSSTDSTSKTDKKDDAVMTENEKQTQVKNVLNQIKEAATAIDTNLDLTYTTQDVYDTNSPNYLVSSARTAMPLEKSFGFVITATDSSDLIKLMVGKATEKITGLGFNIYEDVPQNISGQNGWINTSKKMICTPISDNETSLSISCGHTSWLSAEKIALTNLLADAYKKEEGEYPEYIDASPKEIEDSPFRPYQKIVATMPNFAGLFYRPSSDADWVYFRGTQSVITCKDYYADTGAHHAFQGDVCLDYQNQMSTVKENIPTEESRAR